MSLTVNQKMVYQASPGFYLINQSDFGDKFESSLIKLAGAVILIIHKRSENSTNHKKQKNC